MSEAYFKSTLVRVCAFYGVTKAGIAGIYGNARVECGGDWREDVRQRGGPAIGIFQFEPAMKADFDSKFGGDMSYENQIKYLLDDCRNFIGAGNHAKMMNALKNNDVDEATRAVCNYFERPGKPHMDVRLSFAREYFSEL